jgi:hypothetical protein
MPAELTVRLPAGAGQPNAVAVADENGNLLNAPYTTTEVGGETDVVIQLDRPNFHLEYYDPTFVTEGQSRRYTFDWITPWPVGGASLRVQEPAGAADLRFDPPLAPAGAGEFGLNYYSMALGPLASGQAVHLQLDYTKAIPGLSVEGSGAGIAVTPDLPAPPSPVIPAEALWAVAGAGGTLVLVAVALWFVRSRGAVEPEVASGRKRGRRSARLEAARQGADDKPAGQPGGFCTQCGQPYQPGDRFCRNCGAPRRQ